MKSSEFAAKFKSKYLWGNLAAMVLVVVILCIGVKFGLDLYTHHGESILVPNVRHKSIGDVEKIMADAGLKVVVSDTGYVKSLPPDVVLEQNPAAGEAVKSGHIIYVTINSPHTPTLVMPDIIDNSSLREAMAKLTSLGFNLGQPKYIPGEKDWVYGVLAGGNQISAGARVPVNEVITIIVGNGQISQEDSEMLADPTEQFDVDVPEGDIDEFEEVPLPEGDEDVKEESEE